MALLTLHIPDHEVAFIEQQLALMGYTAPGIAPSSPSHAERNASAAQKTMLKAFQELRAAHMASAAYKKSDAVIAEAHLLHEKLWGPGL